MGMSLNQIAPFAAEVLTADETESHRGRFESLKHQPLQINRQENPCS
jgi:hypothetical protein